MTNPTPIFINTLKFFYNENCRNIDYLILKACILTNLLKQSIVYF